MHFSIQTATGKSEIFCDRSWKDLAELLPSAGVVTVTDENVDRLYSKYFPEFPVLIISPGESSKTLSTVDILIRKLVELEVDRSGFILGIGGGVVCDIAGFVASVYMRGIRSGFVSTSLLSQVDASVGGKNGVNSGGVKNMIGTFSQPEFVICDSSMLSTLPEDEYLSGLAELVKMAVILDKELFETLEENRDAIMKRDESLMKHLVSRSVALKAKVVNEDEKESGLRRILNFGHTFGHVIETATGMKHGLAVAAGMDIAAGMSVAKGLMDSAEYMKLKKLMTDFKLLRSWNLKQDLLLQGIMKDKKREKESINFVLSGGVGNATVMKLSAKEITDLYNRRLNK